MTSASSQWPDWDRDYNGNPPNDGETQREFARRTVSALRDALPWMDFRDMLRCYRVLVKQYESGGKKKTSTH